MLIWTLSTVMIMSVLAFQTCYVMYMYIRLQHYRVWLFESYIKMWPIIYSYFYCDFILELNIVMNILKLFILILKMHVHVSSLKIINKICCIYMYNFLFSLFENIGLIKVKIIKIQSLMNTKKALFTLLSTTALWKKRGRV